MNLSDFDWKNVLSGIIGAALLHVWHMILEWRRRICFSVTRVYFGPTMSYNGFLGREYPLDDLISLDASIKFFSNKSMTTGLHNFRLEFCRTTYIRRVCEHEIASDHIDRDIMKSGVDHSLETLELPPREFVSFDILTIINRDEWPTIRPCDFVRVACDTPEGRTKRFSIGRIKFPEMPSEGIRGMELMSTFFTQEKGLLVIRAQRRHNVMFAPGYQPPPDDIRYWSGKEWVRSVELAKSYKDINDGKAEGEKIRIWELVPPEWR